MALSRHQRRTAEDGRRPWPRPSGVELGQRLKDLPSAQSDPINRVLAANGLVSVGLEVVAAVAYARAVRRAYTSRHLGIRPAIREACTPGLLALSGLHLSYKLLMRFALVHWVDQAVRRAERRSGSA